MESPAFWMFANGFMLALDVICLSVLAIHLIVRRKEFSWQQHGFSVGMAIYVFGHLIFRFLYWHLWSHLASTDPIAVAAELITLFDNPVVRVAAAFNAIGLLIVIWVLSSRVRLFWLISLVFSVLVSALAVYLRQSK